MHISSVEFFVYDAPAGGKLVNWSSDAPLAAVILRSGQDAATYEYEPPATNASGLQPPLVDRDGRNLAAVIACYQPDPIDVGIDIHLSDSTDPVEVGHPIRLRDRSGRLRLSERILDPPRTRSGGHRDRWRRLHDLGTTDPVRSTPERNRQLDDCHHGRGGSVRCCGDMGTPPGRRRRDTGVCVGPGSHSHRG